MSEDILFRSTSKHEFAHLLYDTGLTPQQRRQWEQIYEQGVKAGCFSQNAYARSNELEYFACLTECVAGAGNRIGEIYNGPAAVQREHPAAFEFLKDIYLHTEEVAQRPNPME